MSRLAREHPEDERYQSLEGQREVLSEWADRADHDCKRCEGAGSIDRELMGDLAVSVEACPDCGGTGAAA